MKIAAHPLAGDGNLSPREGEGMSAPRIVLDGDELRRIARWAMRSRGPDLDERARLQQRLPLGASAPPFNSAAREALRRYQNSLRRLEIDGWAIEADRGGWVSLSELKGKRTRRKSSALALDFE